MKLAAVLLVTGCWTDPPPARPEPPPPRSETATLRRVPAPSPTCAATIAHVYDVLSNAHDASFDALELRFRDALVGTCEDMQWSGDLRSCIAGGQTEDELDTCRERMTQDQRDDVKRVLEGTP
jgi:hypothetical protein